MENAINRELPWDTAKMVAFPPLWVSPGAKIVRQHEAELNWKDRFNLRKRTTVEGEIRTSIFFSTVTDFLTTNPDLFARLTLTDVHSFDRMQDWETQKPERPTIYKLAIRDNLLKIGNKDYGNINHGYRTNCIGYD